MKKWMCALLLPLLAACYREASVQQQSALTPPPPAPPRPAVNYYEGTQAADAIQQIRAKVGEPFRVLKVRVDEDTVWLQAQDPKKPENVDEYRLVRGELRAPTPVRLIGHSDQETLEANLFDPADVDWTKIPDLIREANEKVQLEGRELSGISIDRDMFDERRPIEIDVDYRGTRKNGYLRADRRGANAKVRIY